MLIVPFVSGWRKLTVGKYHESIGGSVDFYGFSSEIYNPTSIQRGELSDRFLNEKTIASIETVNYSSSRYKDYTQIIFSNYDSLPERTLYLKRKDKETIALAYTTGEGIKYRKYDVVYFTEDDVGKTIDIYLGITPPLREKLRELFSLGGFSHAEQRGVDACRKQACNGVDRQGQTDRLDWRLGRRKLRRRPYCFRRSPRAYYYLIGRQCHHNRSEITKRIKTSTSRHWANFYNREKLQFVFGSRFRENNNGLLHSRVSKATFFREVA